MRNRYQRTVPVVLLLLLGPTFLLRPAAVDALLIHIHDDFHAHAIALTSGVAPRDTHNDSGHHDRHDHSHVQPIPTGDDGRDFVLIFPKVLVASRGTPYRTATVSEQPAPPWMEPVERMSQYHCCLQPATGPPPPAFLHLNGKTATLLLLNHALLL